MTQIVTGEPATIPPGTGPTPGPVPVPPPRPPLPRWAKLAGLGAAVGAGLVYVALYDPGASSALYPPCPFHSMTGLDCPGCGITRSLHALVTGDPLRALDHNVLFVAALPVLAWLVLRATLAPARSRRPTGPSPRWQPWMTWGAAALVAGFWVVRNLPGLDWLAATAG